MLAARILALLVGLPLLAAQAGANTEITLLGTGGGAAAFATRAQPANAIWIDGTIYLVDCGDGVAVQLERAGLGHIYLYFLRHIFVTHHHVDHMADLVALPMLMWGDYLEEPLTLHGPKPIKKAVKAGLKQFKFARKDSVNDWGYEPLKNLLEVHQITKDGVVLDDDNVTVTAARVYHVPLKDAFAYRFDTKNAEAVSVVFSGDTAPSDALVALAQGADVLVHEVLTVTPEDAPGVFGLPADDPLLLHILNSHTNFQDVGAVANAAGVTTLVLTHFVPADLPFDEAAILAEIRKSFAGEVIFGVDLLTLTYP